MVTCKADVVTSELSILSLSLSVESGGHNHSNNNSNRKSGFGYSNSCISLSIQIYEIYTYIHIYIYKPEYIYKEMKFLRAHLILHNLNRRWRLRREDMESATRVIAKELESYLWSSSRKSVTPRMLESF